MGEDETAGVDNAILKPCQMLRFSRRALWTYVEYRRRSTRFNLLAVWAFVFVLCPLTGKPCAILSRAPISIHVVRRAFPFLHHLPHPAPSLRPTRRRELTVVRDTTRPADDAVYPPTYSSSNPSRSSARPSDQQPLPRPSLGQSPHLPPHSPSSALLLLLPPPPPLGEWGPPAGWGAAVGRWRGKRGKRRGR